MPEFAVNPLSQVYFNFFLFSSFVTGVKLAVLFDLVKFHFCLLQRLLRMLDGLNFKEFVAFLSAFSSRTSLQQKIECRGVIIRIYELFISVIYLYGLALF